MESIKKLGIWMDYSTANLMNPDREEHSIIRSGISSPFNENVASKGEKHVHQKEQQIQKDYFKEIAKKIVGYDQVLLFGPTKAKTELHHFLQQEASFKNLKIAVESADQMTDNQKNAFVRKHFNL